MEERKKCPSCRSESFVPLCLASFESSEIARYLEHHYEGRASIDALHGSNFELVRCTECELAYQRTVPDDRLLSEIYDEWIPKSERSRIRDAYTIRDYQYWAEQVQFLIRQLRMPPHLINILDFGIGWAEWAKMAAAFGCNVTGIELSEERKSHARSIGLEIIEYDDLKNRKFHFINTEQVFEHIVNPYSVLKQLYDSLEPSGILKISVPNASSTLRKLERQKRFPSAPQDIMPIAPLEHINCFEHKSLTSFATQVGLMPLRPRLRDLLNSSSGWFDARHAVKIISRSIYRFIFPKSTFMYFIKT